MLYFNAVMKFEGISTTEADDAQQAFLIDAGLRFGNKGTQSSRTIMLGELRDLLAVVPEDASRNDYANAIVEDNVLGKQTAATRRLTRQRLAELYGLDPAIPIFRVLRRLWTGDEPGRPLLAMLCALARDPLLRATRDSVLSLPIGTELMRARAIDDIHQLTGSRLNEAVLDKVARNAASSWSQSGHLRGRVRKIRQRLEPTPGSLAMALWLGTVEGLAGPALLDSQWARVLDRRGEALLDLALQAKQQGLIHVRAGGGIVEIDARSLDSYTAMRHQAPPGSTGHREALKWER
jgi:hypothetical protein